MTKKTSAQKRAKGNGERAKGDGERAGGNGRREEHAKGREPRAVKSRGVSGTAPRSETRRRCEHEIEQTFGFVPSFYDVMPEPVFEHAWGLHRDFELRETALEPMVKELIGLSMASHIKCRYCIYFHTEAALHHGATQEQLREAILMGGLTVFFSNSLSGAQLDLEEFKSDVDRALAHVARSEPNDVQRARAAQR